MPQAVKCEFFSMSMIHVLFVDIKILKELRNRILRIIRVRSLLCSTWVYLINLYFLPIPSEN